MVAADGAGLDGGVCCVLEPASTAGFGGAGGALALVGVGAVGADGPVFVGLAVEGLAVEGGGVETVVVADAVLAAVWAGTLASQVFKTC